MPATPGTCAATPTVKHDQLKHQPLKKCPGGSEEHRGAPTRAAVRMHVFGGHGGEKIELRFVLRVRSYRVVKQVAFETPGRAVKFYAFMQNTDKFSAVAPVQTQFIIGIPTRVANPAAQIICHQGKILSALVGRRFLPP